MSFKDRVVTRNSSRVILSAHNKVISIDQLGNYTKNPLLVRVFRELGWVEDLGSGNVMGGVETHCEELFPRIAVYRSSRIAMN